MRLPPPRPSRSALRPERLRVAPPTSNAIGGRAHGTPPAAQSGPHRCISCSGRGGADPDRSRSPVGPGARGGVAGAIDAWSVPDLSDRGRAPGARSPGRRREVTAASPRLPGPPPTWGPALGPRVGPSRCRSLPVLPPRTCPGVRPGGGDRPSPQLERPRAIAAMSCLRCGHHLLELQTNDKSLTWGCHRVT